MPLSTHRTMYYVLCAASKSGVLSRLGTVSAHWARVAVSPSVDQRSAIQRPPPERADSSRNRPWCARERAGLCASNFVRISASPVTNGQRG